MSPAVQNIIALILVAGAALYLVWQVLRRKKAGGCASGCGHCEATHASKTQKLIRVDALLTSDKDKS
ncbi:MAG: FeoB-associated Cys-rich membrane protein [Abditibacteriales bacterium]|nr:FeoB-associated Cys-rich membrane protein [Abditibacteriales bacterium]MDW8364684.1 FeoB-associated Cys-rich membrane protein [Abditibacteriales bacterium]